MEWRGMESSRFGSVPGRVVCAHMCCVVLCCVVCVCWGLPGAQTEGKEAQAGWTWWLHVRQLWVLSQRDWGTLKDFKASDMVSLSFKNCHCQAEDKVEKADLRKNDRLGGSGPQLVPGTGLNLAISEINLAVFKIRCGGGRGGRTPSMKSDPTEMVTSMQMTVGFHCPIPVLFLLPLLLTLDTHHMVLF